MARNNSKPLIAGGTINPATFIKVSTVADNTALASTDGSSSHGDLIIGIAQVGTHDTPGVSSNTYAATTNQPIEYFAEGDVCLLKAGSGGWTAGDNIKSASDSTGITASSGDNVGAKAFQTVNAGEYGVVQVMIFKM